MENIEERELWKEKEEIKERSVEIREEETEGQVSVDAEGQIRSLEKGSQG